MTDLKLKAQKILIGKSGKAFLVSVMPALLALTLLYLNYYLLLYFKNNTDINLFIKIFVLGMCFLTSLFLVKAVAFMRENYFFRLATHTFVPLSARDVFCYFAVSVIKTLLSFSLGAVFFTPSGVLLYCAYISRLQDYSDKVSVTLALAAAATALVGAGCLLVLWGRYSKSTYVQLKYGETGPVKALAKSVELMEGKQIKYALFKLSFLGWDLLCLLLLPIAFVLPYRKCAKYVFFNEKAVKHKKYYTDEKPVVFIFG